MRVKDGLTCLQLSKYLRRFNDLMREVRVGIDAIPHLGQRTENHGRIDGLGTKLITDKDEGQ